MGASVDFEHCDMTLYSARDPSVRSLLPGNSMVHMLHTRMMHGNNFTCRCAPTAVPFYGHRGCGYLCSKSILPFQTSVIVRCELDMRRLRFAHSVVKCFQRRYLFHVCSYSVSISGSLLPCCPRAVVLYTGMKCRKKRRVAAGCVAGDGQTLGWVQTASAHHALGSR